MKVILGLQLQSQRTGNSNGPLFAPAAAAPVAPATVVSSSELQDFLGQPGSVFGTMPAMSLDERCAGSLLDTRNSGGAQRPKAAPLFSDVAVPSSPVPSPAPSLPPSPVLSPRNKLPGVTGTPPRAFAYTQTSPATSPRTR